MLNYFVSFYLHIIIKILNSFRATTRTNSKIVIIIVIIDSSDSECHVITSRASRRSVDRIRCTVSHRTRRTFSIRFAQVSQFFLSLYFSNCFILFVFCHTRYLTLIFCAFVTTETEVIIFFHVIKNVLLFLKQNYTLLVRGKVEYGYVGLYRAACTCCQRA